MKAARIIAAAAALLGVTGADAQQRAKPAEAQLFCHDLKRLVRAAPGFELMFKARPAPPWLGFRPGTCRAHAANETLPAAYWCSQQLAPEHLALESLAAKTAACLPGAKRVKTNYWREAVFETPRVRILITESGGPGAKVGRIAGYRVEAMTR
jgi:hypothetical protein